MYANISLRVVSSPPTTQPPPTTTTLRRTTTTAAEIALDGYINTPLNGNGIGIVGEGPTNSVIASGKCE